MATLPAHAEGSSSIDVIDASVGGGGRGLMLFCQTRVLDKLFRAVLLSILTASRLPTPSPSLLCESLAFILRVPGPGHILQTGLKLQNLCGVTGKALMGMCVGGGGRGPEGVESGREPNPREKRSQATTKDYSVPEYRAELERVLKKKAGLFISPSCIVDSWNFCKE